MTAKMRNSNIELYRIIVMILIVAHHYVVNSGLVEVIEETPMSSKDFFYLLFGAWGKTGINCFVLITGYFMCKTEISLTKFLRLFLWIFTYSIIITGIFTLVGYTPLQLSKMWMEIVPFRNITLNFGTCFMLFYLCIPFLNILINNMTKRQHALLIMLLMFIYTLHGSVPKVDVYMNYVSWFCVVYFISSYLRLYPLKKDDDRTFWLVLTIISWSLSILSIFFLSFIQMKYTDNIQVNFSYLLISDSNSILALSNGVTSFMLFKNITIKKSKIINTISACSFGVLIIHANSNTMRMWLWNDIVDCVGHYDVEFYWLYAIASVLCIYLVCTLIDLIRMNTIETPLLNASEMVCKKIWCKFRNQENDEKGQ